MNSYGRTHATTRRRLLVARIAGPALVLLLAVTAGAVPAQAADASAGAAWSQLMRRKLALQTNSALLTASLPGLRAAATTRDSDLARARRAVTAAAATLATATAADEAARANHATAKAAVATAKKAVTAAQKHRPIRRSRITAATRALTAATAAVQARAAAAARTAAAVRAAQTAQAAATNQVARATAASLTATQVVSDTQQMVTSIPRRDAILAAQAAALSSQVVTQTRAGFTTAQTTQVYGITVNKIVAYPFQRMIDDAAKAGVQLSGGGFRTTLRQIELRTSNGCPNVWTAPASSCRVPTAIPGRSLHELGLAIDLTAGKKTITDRRSKAFKWLAANAAGYGFVNLPSEPWHWSITGS